MSQKAREEQRERRAARREAAKDCQAHQGNRNAFRRCVARKAKAGKRKMDRADRRARVKQRNAAKDCDEERSATPASQAAFAAKYGTNPNKKNAFGRCVSQKAPA